MTKEEFHTIISKPESELEGYELHLKYLWKNNSSKRIFSITGLDFSDMMKGLPDTSGIQINNPFMDAAKDKITKILKDANLI